MKNVTTTLDSIGSTSALTLDERGLTNKPTSELFLENSLTSIQIPQ
jgi:hypothetical protein